MDVIDSIREHDPIVAPVVVDNSELYKGMICQDKETLQHMAIRCKKWAEGCTWRLRASKKKHTAFGPCIEAFSRCRLVIQIDGTQLYGKYRGKLLIATSVDSNGHLLLLALAIVDEKSADSWGWFLQHHKKVVFHDKVWMDDNKSITVHEWSPKKSSNVADKCFGSSNILYALDKILKWATRSSKHEVQSYDRHEGMFHVKTGRHSLNAKGGNIQILRLNASE
ncbi:serine/threonine-protein phosphatase 7 long form-like protein [Cucumis melo var. makuwa]|uniref:Serine/threonine-protein phosphatase 7 long form-like protein n=1 Tax=Cucumis melo var. makuwa TaxID=1194695 RepID=A0A5D3BWU3_CUCMM|nr:serine/threonine-protein phosphatase 7 long form-like protein [Cucumis melo var. makuwa]